MQSLNSDNGRMLSYLLQLKSDLKLRGNFAHTLRVDRNFPFKVVGGSLVE